MERAVAQARARAVRTVSMLTTPPLLVAPIQVRYDDMLTSHFNVNNFNNTTLQRLASDSARLQEIAEESVQSHKCCLCDRSDFFKKSDNGELIIPVMICNGERRLYEGLGCTRPEWTRASDSHHTPSCTYYPTCTIPHVCRCRLQQARLDSER